MNSFQKDMKRLQKLVGNAYNKTGSLLALADGGQMFRKLEDQASSRWRGWYVRHKKKLPVYIPMTLLAWYFCGMFLNSLRLGTAATFHTTGEEIESIWVFSPLRNSFGCPG